MKSLFYLLLLANLGFFLWETFVRLEPAGSDSALRTERQVDTIVLLRELPPAPAVQAESGAAETREVPDAPPPAETPSAPAEAPIAPEPAASAETVVQAGTTPPVPETPPAPPPAPPVAPQAELRDFCATLGPFDAEAEARAAVRGIEGVRDSRVEARGQSVEVGYWVLRPPAASLEEAQAVKRKLLEQGAKDALVLREGENANAVSLGFFRLKTGAETLLGEYRAKGLEGLEIRPRRAGKTEYWLHVRARGESAAWKAALERAGAQRPGLSVEERAKCGGVGAGRS